MRSLVLFAILVALPLPMLGAQRIGVLLPADAAEAESMRRGIEVAASMAKARGREVEFVFSGAHGQWGTEGDEAARLVLDEKVSSLIAPRDRAITHLALQVSGRTATPLATLCPDSSATGTGTPWCVRVVPGTRDAVHDLFIWCRTNAPRSARCAAIVPSGRVGSEVAADIHAAAMASQVILTNCVPHAGVPFQTAAVVTRTVVDVTLLCIDRKVADDVAREVRRSSPKILLLFPGSLRADREFAGTFVQRFKSAPDATAVGAADAALALAERCGDASWPACGHDHQGASGTLKFDRSGNRVGLRFLPPVILDSE